MIARTFLLLFLFSCILQSCTISISKDDEKDGKGTGASISGNAKTRNGIELDVKGLHVEQAFLVFEDGTLVADDNKINVNQKVIMRLLMGGWKEENGKVFPGAAEKIATDDGKVIMDEGDLFAAYDAEGVNVADAKIITLSAKITQIDKLYEYFLVSFRIWDKKGSGEINGTYKLYLQ